MAHQCIHSLLAWFWSPADDRGLSGCTRRMQELSDAAMLLSEGSLALVTGDKDRQRRLRWQQRLGITQATLATQVRSLCSPLGAGALRAGLLPVPRQRVWVLTLQAMGRSRSWRCSGSWRSCWAPARTLRPAGSPWPSWRAPAGTTRRARAAVLASQLRLLVQAA